MKLYHSPASPFVRKALVAAHELGLAERIEIVGVAMTPVAGVDALNAENPLGKDSCPRPRGTGPPSTILRSSASTSTRGTTDRACSPRRDPSAGPRSAARRSRTGSSTPRSSAATRPSSARPNDNGRIGSTDSAASSAAPSTPSRARRRALATRLTSVPSRPPAPRTISTSGPSTTDGATDGHASQPG